MKKAKQSNEIAPMANRAPGRFTGPLCIILGLFILACSLGYFGASYLIYHNSLLYNILVLILPVCFSIYLIILGSHLNRRVEVYKEFKRVFRKQPFSSIKQLAKTTNMTEKRVKKYLTKFIDLDLYPSGEFSYNDTYFVLSPKALDLLNTELEKQEEKKKEDNNLTTLKNDFPQYYASVLEIDKTIKYIKNLRTKEASLEDPALKANLDRMDYLLKKIEVFIINNPNDIPNVQNFLEYFLPTVKKLLEKYCELDKDKLQTKNITDSKKQIESSLNSINEAFENLYNDFYSGTALDVYSDVTVLKTMIQKEGLADSDFNN